MRYSYQVVPFQPGVKEGAKSDAVAAQLQRLIDHYVTHGWQYYRLEQITVMVAPGCLGSLFGAKSIPVVVQSVVFRAPLE